VRLLWVLGLVSGCIETELSVDPPVDVPELERPADPDAPIADAGESFAAAPLATVRLDGTGSYDPNERPIVPRWRVIDAPEGSAVQIAQADAFEPEVSLDLAGTYTFELAVRNDLGLWSDPPDTVRVVATPPESVFVQLTWDAEVDLDLQLVPSRRTVFSPGVCAWCAPRPDWGVPGVHEDDPSLDADAIVGFGPETITIPVAAAGEFQPAVHYYGQDGDTRCRAERCPPTIARIDLYVDGEHVHRVEREMTTRGEVWTPFRLRTPEMVRTDVGDVTRTDLVTCVER
jgi:hypothetical protein